MWLHLSWRCPVNHHMVVQVFQLLPVLWICRIPLYDRSCEGFCSFGRTRASVYTSCSKGTTKLCTTFAPRFLAQMTVDVMWPWNTLWMDETHFCLNAQVEMHNYPIWAAEDPHVIHKEPMHAAKVTVWCGFITGPYFFLKEVTPAGICTCSVNWQRYHDMLTMFAAPQLQQYGYLWDTIFMQDGTPPNIANSVWHVLHQTFTDDRVISH